MRVTVTSSATLAAVALATTSLFAACDGNNSGFKGKPPINKLKATHATDSVANPIEPEATPYTPPETPTPRPEVTFVETPSPTPQQTPGNTLFSGKSPVTTASNQKEVWVVTADKAYRIALDESRGFPITSWTMPSRIGNRTYVSEIGLIVGKTIEGNNPGAIYRVSDDNPTQSDLIYKPTDAGDPTRICVTSFRINGTVYIGAAYRTSANERKFIRFPVDKTKANKVDLTKIESVLVGTTTNPHASYSCFVDQARGFFWVGGYRGSGGDLWGVNLNTMVPLANTNVPNAGHTNNVVTISTTSNLSYALAGDGQGNLLTGQSMYTYAHEPVADVVFGSNGSTLTVTRGECFRNVSDCTNKHWSFSGITVGPLSSLNDGRVMGLTRGSPSQVFLLSLKDKNDPSKGVTARKIADIPGDPYMYTDFTGATLYAALVEKSISLRDLNGYNAGKSVAALKLKWIAESGAAEDWRGLSLALRCYTTSGNKPAYTEIANVPKSGETLVINLASCSGAIDAIDLKISPAGNTSAFSRIKEIEISGEQNP